MNVVSEKESDDELLGSFTAMLKEEINGFASQIKYLFLIIRFTTFILNIVSDNFCIVFIVLTSSRNIGWNLTETGRIFDTLVQISIFCVNINDAKN